MLNPDPDPDPRPLLKCRYCGLQTRSPCQFAQEVPTCPDRWWLYRSPASPASTPTATTLKEEPQS